MISNFNVFIKTIFVILLLIVGAMQINNVYYSLLYVIMRLTFHHFDVNEKTEIQVLFNVITLTRILSDDKRKYFSRNEIPQRLSTMHVLIVKYIKVF